MSSGFESVYESGSDPWMYSGSHLPHKYILNLSVCNLIDVWRDYIKHAEELIPARPTTRIETVRNAPWFLRHNQLRPTWYDAITESEGS